MSETSARLLRLLSLLQAQRDWTGTELAARLGVTTRTIRNDIGPPRGCATRSAPSSRTRCRCRRLARGWIRTC